MIIKTQDHKLYTIMLDDNEIVLLNKVVSKMSDTSVIDIRSLLTVVIRTVLTSCLARGC